MKKFWNFSGRGLRGKNIVLGGLFSNFSPEGVLGVSGRPIRNGRPGLDPGKREGEEGAGRRRGRERRRRCHCWPAQARRRNSIGRYGTWFCDPKTPGEREGQGELDPGLGVTGESPRGPLHGRRPWSSPEHTARGLGSTKIQRIRSRRKQRGWGSSLSRRSRRGRLGRRPSRGGRGGGFSAQDREERRQREKKLGRGRKKARAHGVFSN